jgi:MFS transporter, putative metabolite transport protein
MASVNDATAGPEVTTDAFKKKFMARLIVVLSGGMFLDGYILGIIGPVSAVYTKELGISSVWEGLITAAALFGILFGSPLGGDLSDKIGRKPLFMLDIALFTVAATMQFFITGPLMFLIVRFLMGVAIGMEYSVGWPMMAEFSPAKLRGRLMGLTVFMWYVGFMVAFAVGYCLNKYTSLNWRFIIGTSAFIALALLLGRLGMPESPQWLWNKGKQGEARGIATKYMSTTYVSEMEQAKSGHGTGKVSELFSHQYWRATFFTSVFWFANVAPYFAIATFADQVLQKYGLAGGLAGGVGMSAVTAAAVGISVLMVDKIGRRPLAVWPLWTCAVVLAIISLWSGAPAALVLTLFLIFSAMNGIGGMITSIYPGEVFPVEVRGVGTGFTAAVSRVGAGMGTFLLPWSIANLGMPISMGIFAVIALIGAVVTQWLAPETGGKTLAELADHFGH